MLVRRFILAVITILFVVPSIVAQESDSASTDRPAPDRENEQVAENQVEDRPNDNSQPKKKNKIIIRYDDSGMMMIEGLSKDVSNFEYIYEELLAEAKKTLIPLPDTRFYKVKHIDVTLAKAILDDVFNPGAKARQQTARDAKGRQPTRQQAGKKGKQPEPEPEPDRRGTRGIMDLLGLGSSGIGDDRLAELKAKFQQGINVVAEKQRGFLFITAPTELFPSIIGLLHTIDTPAERQRDYEIIVLKKLNADDVKTALEEVLGLRQTARTVRQRPVRRPQQRGRGGSTTEQLAEMLQEQMLQLGEGSEFKPSDIRIASNPSTNSIIVVAPKEAMVKIKEIVESLEEQEIIDTEFRPYVLEHASASEIAPLIEELFKSAQRQRPSRDTRGRGAARGATPTEIGNVAVKADTRTNTLYVRALSKDWETIEEIIKSLDSEDSGPSASSYVLENASATSLAKSLEALYGKSKRGGVKSVRIVADNASNTLFVVAPPSLRSEIEMKIAEVEGKAEQLNPRFIQILQGDAETIAATLKEVYAKQKVGKTKIQIAADTSSNQLIVSAPDEVFKKISELVSGLDRLDQQQVRPKTYRLKYADAVSVKKQIDNMLQQLWRQMKAQKKGKAPSIGPFGVTADPNTNSLTVMGTPEAFALMEQVLAEIDIESENTRKFRTVKLSGGDAADVAKTMQMLINQQGGKKGQAKPSVTADAATNTLIIYASDMEMTEFQPLIDSMDVEDSVGHVPQQIALKHQGASELAELCTRLFTEPAKKQGRGRGGIQKQIPLIMADERSNSLIVRAQEADYQKILALVQTLDKEATDSELAGIRIIQVAQGVDVEEMARIIEDNIKKGEDFKKRLDKNYKPKYVAINADTRTGSLIVSGAASQFDVVEKTVRTLEKMKPTGPRMVKVINLTNVRSSEVKKVLDQLVEERKKKTGRRRR